MPPRAGARAKKPAKMPRAGSPADAFDRKPYELPVLDLGEAIALATALVKVKPPRAAPAIAEDIARVAAACNRAKAVAAGGAGGAPSVDARAYDVAMDRAWATFVRRIQDHAELPAERHADAAEAAKVHAIVGDLSILKLNYFAEFAQIGGRLDALKREGLLESARRFAGAPFLDEVLRCHAEYGEALGVGPARADEGSLLERGAARLELVQAIEEYAFQVMAQARAGHPGSWPPVKAALRPIAALRGESASG